MSANIPVDIIMGTYNGARFLQDQIDSLLAQTHTNWRLIARDDGSSDGTVDLVRKATKKDPRIVLVSDELGNLGFSRNFLHLLSLSNAPYVMFCDQDDIWLPRKVEMTLREMIAAESIDAAKPILVHCDATVIDKDLTVLRPRFIGARGKRPSLSGMLFANCVQGAASMVNGPLRDRALLVSPLLPYDFHCGLIAAAVGRRRFLDDALLLYRQHGNNTIGAGSVKASTAKSKISPTLQLAFNASGPVMKTVYSFGHELAPDTAREMADFAELLAGNNRLKRLWIALRRRYAFFRRRDKLNLLLYIFDLPNV